MTHPLLPAGWKLAQQPKKGEYKDKALLMLADSPNTVSWLDKTPSPLKAGSIIHIERRLTLADARAVQCIHPKHLVADGPDNTRMLRVSYKCPHCHGTREEILPEAWIDASKLVFIEIEQ